MKIRLHRIIEHLSVLVLDMVWTEYIIQHLDLQLLISHFQNSIMLN